MANLVKKIGVGTFFLTLQKISNTVFAVLINYFVIKYLGVNDYGFFVLAMSVVGLMVNFLDGGLGVVIAADMANYRGSGLLGKVKKIIQEHFCWEIILGILLSGIVLVSYFFDDKLVQIKNLLFLGAGIVFLTSFKNVFSTALYAFSRFKRQAFIPFLEVTIKFILVIILFVVLNKRSVEWLMLIQLCSVLIGTLVAGVNFLVIWKELKGIKSEGEKLIFNIIKQHGKWQIFYNFLKNVSENLRYWIITFFVGLGGLAIYNVAAQIIAHLQKIISSLETVLIPVLSEEMSRNSSTSQKIIDRSVKYSTWLTFFIIFCGLTLVPALLIILFKDKYLASIPVLFVMLIGLPTSAAGVIFRPIFFHFKEQKQLFFIGLKINLVAIPIYIFLTYLTGVFGYAFPFTEYYGFHLRYQLLKRMGNYKLNLKEIFKIDAEDKILIKKIFSFFKSKIKI